MFSKNSTLFEAQEFCRGFSNCNDCPIGGPNIEKCPLGFPEGWGLDFVVKFTAKEITWAQYMLDVLGPTNSPYLYRTKMNCLCWNDESGYMDDEDNKLPYKMFPQITPGEKVYLKDIVGDEDVD